MRLYILLLSIISITSSLFVQEIEQEHHVFYPGKIWNDKNVVSYVDTSLEGSQKYVLRVDGKPFYMTNIQTREDSIWIATFAEVAAYKKECDNTTFDIRQNGKTW
jgi:hypothetical protein